MVRIFTQPSPGYLSVFHRAFTSTPKVHLDMLIDVYPRHVIEFLATHGTGAVPEAVAQLAHSHTGISIFFMDVVGFTPMSKDADPQDVMKMLNELFTALDTLCGARDVYKVRLTATSGSYSRARTGHYNFYILKLSPRETNQYIIPPALGRDGG